MIARIDPRPLAGTVPAIASKSLAHRHIIAAALANGTTRVECATTCEDIEATVRCLETLGARIERDPRGFTVHPVPKSTERGILAALKGRTLDCGESGSTLRFLLPVACALGAEATFTGEGRLGERPIEPLARELVAAGADLGDGSGLPLTTGGRIRPGTFELPGDVSSQYITGLLLAAPLLDGASQVRVVGRLESRPYVDLTIAVLAAFGVVVAVEEGATPGGLPLTVFSVPAGGYRTPGRVTVEGDWSNAAFWLCAGALGDEPVTVTGIEPQSIQGDRAVLAVLALFGARARRAQSAITVRPCGLRPIELDARDIPDLVPVLAAVAACAEGRSRIFGCARLRLKESDRLLTTAEELGHLGAAVAVERDALVIDGRGRLAGGAVDAHGDHRIAMMAAVAATRCDGPVTIFGAEAVNKSYPGFFQHYRQLGGHVELADE